MGWVEIAIQAFYTTTGEETHRGGGGYPPCFIVQQLGRSRAGNGPQITGLLLLLLRHLPLATVEMIS